MLPWDAVRGMNQEKVPDAIPFWVQLKSLPGFKYRLVGDAFNLSFGEFVSAALVGVSYGFADISVGVAAELHRVLPASDN